MPIIDKQSVVTLLQGKVKWLYKLRLKLWRSYSIVWRIEENTFKTKSINKKIKKANKKQNKINKKNKIKIKQILCRKKKGKKINS